MAELRGPGAGADRPNEAGSPAERESSESARLMALLLKTYPDDPKTLRMAPDSDPIDLWPRATSEAGDTGKDPEGVEEEPKGWEAPGVVDQEKRPDRDAIHLTDQRRAHVLDGDHDGQGGGHRHGTGRPGKSEFPESWDDDTAIGHLVSVAHDPDAARLQKNGRWVVSGTRDEVDLEVVVRPDGGIVTGYPTGGPGVVTNPKEPTA